MTRPKPRPARVITDSAQTHPQDYQQGVDNANSLIKNSPPVFVDHALEATTSQMEHWPISQGKATLTDRQYARSKGFADTLREYREAQADV